MKEIIFIVNDTEDGGFVASGLNDSIFTDGETLEELRTNIKEAVKCHFDDSMPKIVRLHLVREEIFSV